MIPKIKRPLFVLISFVFLLFIAASPSIRSTLNVEAAGCTGFFDCLLNPEIKTPNLNSYYLGRFLPGQLISDFLPAILGIAGFITVIVIVISGIQFILSSGNPEAAAAARGRLIFALVGFALIVLAFAILVIVNKLFLGDTGVV